MGALNIHPDILLHNFEADEFWEQEPIVYVNGKRRRLPKDLAYATLLEYLRGLGLTGTKLGCGEGGCGACTVMVSHFDPEQQNIVHRAVNACLAPLYSIEGMHVVTVEGVGSREKGLHKIQDALASSHGSQCGFCTPGFVMSMYALLRSAKGAPTQEEIEQSLAGNLCRCTGYRPILDAFRVFGKTDSSLYIDHKVREQDSSVGGIEICPSTGKPCNCGDSVAVSGDKEISLSRDLKDDSVSGEPLFPAELKFRKSRPLFLRGIKGLRWYRPTSLSDLLSLKCKYPDAKLVCGSTEVGIESRFKNVIHPVLIAPTHVPELSIMHVTDQGVKIGACVTLARLLDVLTGCVKVRDTFETSACNAFIQQLKWFAGSQIRNVASVGGNICTASPISDLNPLWIASGATFTIWRYGGYSRTVKSSTFFTGYRKVDLSGGEILASVFLPWTRKFEYVREFKQAHRRDDDIAIVNAAMRVLLIEKECRWEVAEASLVYGGVGPTCIMASATESYLQGKPWNEKTLDIALVCLSKDINLSDGAPGGMIEFRKSLTSSFLFKFFLYVTYQLELDTDFVHDLPESYRSAAAPYHRDPSHGMQSYSNTNSIGSVGQPLMHLSAQLQVTGEAEYADDVYLPPNGLHGAFVMSKKPHARIVSLDFTEAKGSPGFEGYFTATDVPGGNDVGAVIADEEVFASEFVTCVGQVIAIVVADSHENAKAAAQKVKIEYLDLPAILTIEEALNAGSFHPGTERVLEAGDVDHCFTNGEFDHLLEGIVQVGGQEHFYLEPNCSTVWTVDGGNEVHMVSSTQAPQKHQKWVAHVLGLPMSKVVCKTKRIGGGFGGKETRSAFIAAAASVPAYLLRRPVRVTLDRDVDMAITGARHAFLGKYKIGVSKEGKVLALDLEIYNNGGNSLDLSHSILERAMFHSDNVYAIPNMRVRGRVCFTNQSSNTAFRGFGGPQGMLITENWIEKVARAVGRSPEAIRELNFQQEGYVLHYGQQLVHCHLQKVWEKLKTSCEFEEKRAEADLFNACHRWKKRGVAMIPTKFGISFTTKFLNQAGALVQVYTDGTVLVTHGGVEMGQGLHTKMAQIAATVFEIPMSSVFISETSTDKVPNSSPTAASASSDMYGAAVLDACQQIKARMKPIADRLLSFSFEQLANTCYMERIDLSAHGFYITPNIGFDWEIGKGKPFNYFTFGAAFAETEIDCLSGDFHLRRADIVMDLGNSLNPAIDVGQIEGAFVQGLGWVALEELKWGDSAHPWVRSGHLFTVGPGTYKIPTANDVPIDFRIVLLEDTPNPLAVHSSKAVGEPPLFLASAALFAIKDAVLAARRESGHHGWFILDSPATPERIRMACADRFTHAFASHDFRPNLSI